MKKAQISKYAATPTKHTRTLLALLAKQKHLSAKAIYLLLQESKHNISQATIYRILNNLETNGVITKHNFQNGQATYELAANNDHHDHLVCIHCHKLIEFYDDDIERIQQQIVTTNNFVMVGHSLSIYGICQDCQKSSL